MLAVVLMFALIASLVAPALHLGGGRAAQREAEAIAGSLEFARQRAVMTGRAHRLVVDLDRASYWVEWVPPPEAGGSAPPGANGGSSARKIAMKPPEAAELRFEPVPAGEFGREHAMDAATRVLEVRLPGNAIDRGVVVLGLTPDGAADPALIRVGSPEGESLFDVRVEALADAALVTDAKR